MILPLEQQITSLELSKRMKELGAPQESYFFWLINKFDGNDIKLWNKDKLNNSNVSTPFVYSAYTIAELGEMLPKAFDNDDFHINLGIEFEQVWTVSYFNIHDGINYHNVEADTEANARALAWIHLKEKGLI